MNGVLTAAGRASGAPRAAPGFPKRRFLPKRHANFFILFGDIFRRFL